MQKKCGKKAEPKPYYDKKRALIVGSIISLLIFAFSVYFDLY